MVYDTSKRNIEFKSKKDMSCYRKTDSLPLTLSEFYIHFLLSYFVSHKKFILTKQMKKLYSLTK